MNDNIQIQELKSINQNQQDQIVKLIFQLNPELKPPNISDTQNVINDPNSHLFIAQKKKNIVGIIALSHYSQVIGDKKAIIEDFVVEEKSRNLGIGKKLMQFATDYAKKNNCTILELTSNPTRCEANNFYQKHGFEQRETNCYRKRI